MNILEKICLHKQKEVTEKAALYPVKLLEQSIHFSAPTVSLKQYLLRDDKCGIIAEFKRRSPSKGDINPYAKPEEVTLGYMQGGASALSVLTNDRFFGGSNKDLLAARKMNYCPILRKDFILTEYQVIETRAIGADAILLIAAVLTASELKQLANVARNLGLEVLFEVHSREEIDKLPDTVELVGINNRNLKRFEVDLNRGASLIGQLPGGVVKVAESGIQSAGDVADLMGLGFQGFLIGERFMRSANPGIQCRNFIRELKQLQKPELV